MEKQNQTTGTNGTGGTVGEVLPPIMPLAADRLETLTETVALMRRATVRQSEELAALRFTVMFAIILTGAILIRNRGGVHL
jgi:hypothetical protein